MPAQVGRDGAIGGAPRVPGGNSSPQSREMVLADHEATLGPGPRGGQVYSALTPDGRRELRREEAGPAKTQ